MSSSQDDLPLTAVSQGGASLTQHDEELLGEGGVTHAAATTCAAEQQHAATIELEGDDDDARGGGDGDAVHSRLKKAGAPFA